MAGTIVRIHTTEEDGISVEKGLIAGEDFLANKKKFFWISTKGNPGLIYGRKNETPWEI